jgi:hypothetical protein
VKDTEMPRKALRLCGNTCAMSNTPLSRKKGRYKKVHGMFDYSWKKGYFYRDRLSEVIDVMQDEYCTPALPLDFSPG